MHTLRSAIKLAAVMALAAVVCAAAKNVSVDELKQLIGDAAARHRSDADSARRIAELEMTERITEDTLAALQSRAAGPQTAAKLAELADQSAFLDAPAGERSSTTDTPSIQVQREIIARASAYTAAYAKRLPNLICTEGIRRFDSNFTGDLERERLGSLRLRDTLVAQLTYSQGEELAKLKSVDGVAFTKAVTLFGVTTSGDFGDILIGLFSSSSHAQAIWSHWEVLQSRRVAVFRYVVGIAHSRYNVSYCCVSKKVLSVTAGFHGFVFIDAEKGTVVRITRSCAGLPVGFPTRQVDTEVEYGTVTMGERPFVCPIRSVTKVKNVPPGSKPAQAPITLLNLTTFTGYRTFEAEGRLVSSASAREVTGQAASQARAEPAARTAGNVVADPAPEFVDESDRQPEPGTLEAVFSIPKLPGYRENAPTESIPPLLTGPTFREQLHVVRLPVVVRDRRGDALRGLTQSDFEVFDNGKQQKISSFTVQGELAANVGHRSTAHDGPSATKTAAEIPQGAVLPDRYVAFVFDDVHLAGADLAQTRAAEQRVLAELLEPGTRIAIFTTSGRTTLDFTADSERIVALLKKIRPSSMSGRGMDCPVIGYLQADLIAVKNDARALDVAVEDAVEHCGVPQRMAADVAKAAARRSLAAHDYEVKTTLASLRAIIGRMGMLPGERTILLVSPGFLSRDSLPDVDAMEDRAVRDGVVINTLDARGLYTLAGFEADERESAAMGEYAREEQLGTSGVLVELANATGGKAFENSNDYEVGFRNLAKRPEVVYLLGFSPSDEKADGRYHKLKVKLKNVRDVEVQSRRGYFASTSTEDTAKQAKEEMQSALFSRDELRQISCTVQVAAGGSGGVNGGKPGHVLVSTHVDLNQLALQKVSGSYHAKLTLAFGFFDRDGKIMDAVGQDFPLNIPETDLAARLKTGVDLKSDLPSGANSRFLRVVLRDESGRMAAENEVLAP